MDCPNCGARVHLDEGMDSWSCNYCRAQSRPSAQFGGSDGRQYPRTTPQELPSKFNPGGTAVPSNWTAFSALSDNPKAFRACQGITVPFWTRAGWRWGGQSCRQSCLPHKDGSRYFLTGP